ncbi:MAG: hypothetical protein HYX94_07085 [Chloroflexi bacterium]|nr:hypothetical protein [Chloroflexota bacterium]
MSWLDGLLGRQKPVKSQLENLFAITTASVTLQTRLGLRSTGKASICIKPIGSSYYGEAKDEITELLKLGGEETGTRAEHRRDSYGYDWLVLADQDFEDLVAAMHVVSTTLDEHGFGEHLLAAVFEFRDEGGQLVCWLYNYKRGRFYPFVPLSTQPEGRVPRRRDNAYELRLRAVMERELPVEPELERWYLLWDVPLSRE